MFAQINHCAIISHQYNMLSKFYEVVFGLKYSAFRLVDAPLVSDGYVGMQLIPRRDGYVGGIDHFGMVVDDVDNVFDLAAKKEDNRKDLYKEIAEKGWHQDRYINKFAIRTPNAEQCAEFYADVFELQPVNRKSEAPGYHLTDGRVTLSILPWSIPVFEG